MEEVDLNLDLDQIDNDYANKVLQLFIDTNDKKYFDRFVFCVQNNKVSRIKVDISKNPNSLLQRYGDLNILEYIVKFNIDIDPFKRLQIANNIELVSVLLDAGYNAIITYIKDDILFDGMYKGRPVIEYLFENNLISYLHIDNIKRIEIVDYIIKYNRLDLFTKLSGSMLFEGMYKGRPIIEYLFENNLVDGEIVSSIRYNDEIIDYLIKYNREDLFDFLEESLLLKEIQFEDGKMSVLEKLLKDGKTFKHQFDDPRSFELIDKYHRWDIYDGFFEFELLNEYNGKTILEYLLDNNIDVSSVFFSDMKSFRIIAEKKRFDLLTAIWGIDKLFNLYDLNKTYIDLILEEYKNNNSFDIKDLISRVTYTNDLSLKAKLYIKFAEYDLIEQLRSLDNKDLLTKKNGKCLLDYLLEYNKELTLNKILSKSVKRDIDVAMYLKLSGIEQEDIDISKDPKEYSRNFMDGIDSKTDNLELSPENEALIAEFKEVMMADGNSEPELVDTMARSYRNLIHRNSPYGVSELKQIISIKRNNPDFCIKRTDDGAFYRPYDSSINMDDNNIDTLNHETGHMLHHELAGGNVPEEIEDIMQRVRQRPETLAMVRDYSSKYQIILENETIKANKIMEDYDSRMTDERRREIEELISSTKEEKISKFMDLGYSREELEVLLGDSLTFDEFIKQDRRVKREELIDTLLRRNHPAFIALGDIIDAIYKGQFRDNKLSLDGKKISGAFGHGIHYYSNPDQAFNEMMANYSSIVKSTNGDKILDYLRRIVGDEFVDFIANYYDNQIVKSTRFSEEVRDNMEEVGYAR